MHDPANWPAALPETYQILETRVLVCHAHAAILQADGTHIDTDRWKPLLYVFRSYVEAGAAMGKTFKAAH